MAKDIYGNVTQLNGEERFLSNFWPAEILVSFGGAVGVWPTTENVYQATKLYFVDDLSSEERTEKIREFSKMTPGEAKRAGSALEVNADWNEDFRAELMTELSFHKFYSNLDLAEKLRHLNEIQEGNDWGDTFFGVDLETGEGQNVLGDILTDLAQEIDKDLSREEAESGYLSTPKVLNIDELIDFMA